MILSYFVLQAGKSVPAANISHALCRDRWGGRHDVNCLKLRTWKSLWDILGWFTVLVCHAVQFGLLQPLGWRCAECAVHHERNVREEQHHIYVARTSNNRVIAACDLYWCLLPQCEALRTCRSGFPTATGSKNSFRINFFRLQPIPIEKEDTVETVKAKISEASIFVNSTVEFNSFVADELNTYRTSFC